MFRARCLAVEGVEASDLLSMIHRRSDFPLTHHAIFLSLQMNRLASLKINKGEVCHVDWADSVSPLLAWASGSISIMDMELKQCSTPIAEMYFEGLYYTHRTVA